MIERVKELRVLSRSIERRRDNGFSIMEILVVMGLLSFFLMIGTLWVKQIKSVSASKETLKKIEIFQEAIRKNFFSNLRYAEANCYGWGDTACSVLTLTPILVDANTLQFNTYDLSILDMFQRAGCKITGDVPNFSVQCYDGRGVLFSFRAQNEHSFGVSYIEPYLNKNYSLEITDGLGKKFLLDIDKEINWALSISTEKITEIATGVKTYIRTKRILELTNVCGTEDTTTNPSGGLNSADDAVIPWIWQALQSPATTLCSGIEDTATNCGCSTFTDTTIWSNDSNLCELDRRGELITFLSNLNLGIRYLTDGLGNSLTIIPLADSSGNPIADCPPPRPQQFYQVIGISKTRIGVKDSAGNWVYYVDTIGE